MVTPEPIQVLLDQRLRNAKSIRQDTLRLPNHVVASY